MQKKVVVVLIVLFVLLPLFVSHMKKTGAYSLKQQESDAYGEKVSWRSIMEDIEPLDKKMQEEIYKQIYKHIQKGVWEK